MRGDAITPAQPPPGPRRLQETQQQTPATSDVLATRMARQYLPQQAWAASAKNQASTVDKSTFWYFQVWKQESDNVISLEPFAMVSKRKDSKPGDRPYSVAADKAYITFASKVSLLGGNPGAIVRANLEGAVQIEGPNNLIIEGRNFYFQKGDPNVVYSDDRLRFRADRHFGTAKGMQLELLRNEKAKPDEPLAIGGISSVKLLQDVDMTLVTDSFEQTMVPGTAPRGGAALQSAAGSRPARPMPERGQLHFRPGDARGDIRTQRPHLPRNRAAQVRFHLRRRQCQNCLRRQESDASARAGSPALAQAAASESHAAKPAGLPANAGDRPAGTFDPNLSFKELHAHGKKVSLVSEANGLEALMHNLDYDRTKRQARLSALPNRVKVLHNGDRLTAPVHPTGPRRVRAADRRGLVPRRRRHGPRR